ncbi:hypothetical protein [Desulfovibrio cuneatus]|uniref:hypothetical protein n=1 Tax=Desulfovibrio cuneatus TaxID=159728 RepID=UPI0004280E0E|nr:hypothetical protein [Desulfovibrio cuneatus]
MHVCAPAPVRPVAPSPLPSAPSLPALPLGFVQLAMRLQGKPFGVVGPALAAFVQQHKGGHHA